MSSPDVVAQLPYDLNFDVLEHAQEVKSTVNTAPTYDQLVAKKWPEFESGLIGVRDRLDDAQQSGLHVAVVIGCGGTFQSKDVGSGYEPVGTLKESFEALQLPKDDTLHLELFDLMNLDSSQMRPEHWRFLADAIVRLNQEAGDLIDSIVVTHGTDTMDKGASYLSFGLQGLQIPILLTGSQEPAFEKNGDAKDQMERTLITAKLAAKQEITEVMVVCGTKVTRGTWAAKQGDKTTDAFGPWNDPRQLHDATDWENAARTNTLERLAPAFIDFGVGKPVGALSFASHALTRRQIGAYDPFTRFGEAADMYPTKLSDKTPENFAQFILGQEVLLLTQLGSATADDRLVSLAISAATNGKAVLLEAPFFDSMIKAGTYRAGSGVQAKIPYINRRLPILNTSPAAVEAKKNYVMSRHGKVPVTSTDGLGAIFAPDDLLRFYDEMETNFVGEMISQK